MSVRKRLKCGLTRVKPKSRNMGRGCLLQTTIKRTVRVARAPNRRDSCSPDVLLDGRFFLRSTGEILIRHGAVKRAACLEMCSRKDDVSSLTVFWFRLFLKTGPKL